MRREYTAVKDEVDAMPSPSESGAAEALSRKLGGFRLRSPFHHVVVQPRN